MHKSANVSPYCRRSYNATAGRRRWPAQQIDAVHEGFWRRRSVLIQEFAERYRLKTRLDECRDTIISGRRGDIFDGFKDRLGLYVSRSWATARWIAPATGMTIRQNGTEDGCLLFDPSDAVQARLAIKLCLCRPKRESSPKQLENLAKARQVRFTGTEGSFGPFGGPQKFQGTLSHSPRDRGY
jgi:hypothetical protein